MHKRALTVGVVAALALGAVLAEYPTGQRDAAAFWLFVDLVLLWRMTRGGRLSAFLLTFETAVTAGVFLLAGSFQLTSDPKIFLRGLASAAATVLVLRLRRLLAQSRAGFSARWSRPVRS